jgi:hypothetical protein
MFFCKILCNYIHLVSWMTLDLAAFYAGPIPRCRFPEYTSYGPQ